MNNNLAPIALFVYNRSDHALKTLSSLSKNPLASESRLFIFSDGPKNNADSVAKVKSVREVIRSIQWCGEVNIIESAVNKGLANSLIAGITDIVNRFGKVIVIEDDFEFSSNFLKYMNESLTRYENEPRVMSICGFTPPIKTSLPETFFLHIPTWWGWATWKRAWDHFNPSASELMMKVKEKGTFEFDFSRSINWYRLLKRNAAGKVDSWAIRWYASVYLQNGLCLHPGQSMVNNIGCDESGIHSYNSNFLDTVITDDIQVKDIPIQKSRKATRAFFFFNMRMKINDLPHYIKSRIKGKYNIKAENK